MCSVEGDYDYLRSDEVRSFEEYLNKAKKRVIIELNMSCIEGLKAIFNNT